MRKSAKGVLKEDPLIPTRMQYQQALDTLASLGPELRTGKALASGVPPRKFSLDHIRILLGELGDPQQKFPSVLIAGTNGKGSTAATLASICQSAGLRTGLYTSPHLLRVNERMRVNGQDIADDAFGRLFERVFSTAEQLVTQQRLPHTPSFFELLTATAFLFFAEQQIALAVLEVGLGGRLDATNVVEPIISVITDIGIDHTEFLGNTLAEIAREKAGILRPDGVLVTLSQHPEANAAIGETAVALNVRGVDAARCLPPRGFIGQPAMPPPIPGPGHSPGEPQVPQLTAVNDVEPFNRNELEGPSPIAHGIPSVASGVPPSVMQFSPLGRNRYPLSLDGEILWMDSPLSGHHQQRNLALAVSTALELRANHGFALSNQAIEDGVRATVWPGRLEWITADPHSPHPHAPLLLDVAHNPAGAWALRSALAQLPDKRPRTLIFSCLADKQIEEMARILLPLFDPTSGDPDRRGDRILLAPIANPRAATVDQLLAVAHSLEIPAHAAPHVAAALQQAQVLTPPEGIIVATGSVYLIGELRHLALAQRGV